MEKQNLKATIIVLLTASALVLSSSIIDMVEAKSDKQNSANTKNDFKINIKKWIMDSNDDKISITEKSIETKSEYNKLLRDIIEKARISTNSKVLSENEILEAVDYIFYETVKDEKLKITNEEHLASTTSIDFLSMLGLPTAHASCPNVTHPNSYKQVSIDINGGTYAGNYYNGRNDLYLVSYRDNTSECERTYTLYFYDEDHPTLDAFYDQVRLVMYNRIHDIESFIIHDNNRIEFDNTWSSTNRFDCTTSIVFGCHQTTTKSYTPGETIYVSNTWNHTMDTLDTNRSLSKVTVP